MKKLILSGLLLPLLFSCEKKDDFNGERPDERLTQTLAAYYDQLSGAANGWKAQLYTDGGNAGGYGFFFKFNNQNRVTMLADINSESGDKAMESSYRIRATLLPSLYFDTYSYIHLLADPDPAVNGGYPGYGQFSDFEFSFQQVGTDTIRLQGNLMGSRLVLTRASADEEAAYEAGNLNKLKTDVNSFLDSHLFNYLQIGNDQEMAVDINPGNKMFSALYDSAGTVINKSIGYAYSGLRDLELARPITLGALTFDAVHVSEDNSYLYVNNGSEQLHFQDDIQPVFPFAQMLGIQFNSLSVRLSEASPGSGAEFNARRESFLSIAATLLAANTQYPGMNLIFDRQAQKMYAEIVVIQGTNLFFPRYTFSYTLEGDNFVFTYAGPNDANAAFIEAAFQPLIEAFTAGPMRVDYEVSSGQLQGKAQSAALPTFTFLGNLSTLN